MKTPDFTPATIPFSGDAIAWCLDCVWRGYGDAIVEETLARTHAALKQKGITPGRTSQERMRKELYRAFAEHGWDEAKLLRMGFIPERVKRPTRSRR